MLAQIDASNADLLKAKLAAPLLDGVGKSGWVEGGAGHGFGCRALQCVMGRLMFGSVRWPLQLPRRAP
ncbi:alpha-N-arabinofuranosidase A [Pseudomonas sp. MT-1]|nr:alpha-N-arabinofuranosidase A [Pseudomonas sp. MT-1]